MNNAELREVIFNKIKSLGFKIKNIENVDGYFILEMGKDSVTHFRLKGHGMWKHWKFGLWCDDKYFNEEYVNEYKTKYNIKESDMNVIQLFAQYDKNIDKFKPTRSALCVSFSLEDFKDNDNFDIDKTLGSYEIEHMLKFMCKHPFMAYEEFCGDYAGFYSGSFIKSYLRNRIIDFKNKAREKVSEYFWLPYTKIKCWFAKKNKIVDKIELIKFSDKMKGWSTNYLYEVNINFVQEATEEEINRWLIYWFHKKNYGKYKYYEYVIEVNNISQIGCDTVWCYYPN